MYRTVLDSTRYEGPLVRLIAGARDAQNWRMDRRALCVEHILRARAHRTKLRHCFVPSIIHLPRLGGPGRTARGRHNWKKAPEGTRETGTPTLREEEKGRQIVGVSKPTVRLRIALLLEYCYRIFYSILVYKSFFAWDCENPYNPNYWRIKQIEIKYLYYLLITFTFVDEFYLCESIFYAFPFLIINN